MRELTLPTELAGWIEATMTDAPKLGRVRIFCGPRIPFDWLPGDRRRYMGMTLWNRIWLREPFELKGEGAHELLFHELVHVRQFLRNPIWFPLAYVFYLGLKGYREHPAEVEARAVAAELRRKFFSAKKEG